MFTKSPVRNLWRLVLAAWLVYVAIGLFTTINGMLPIEPTNKFLGIDLGEPNLLAGYLTAFFALVITAMIYILPALFLWALIEHKFWPQSSSPIFYTTKKATDNKERQAMLNVLSNRGMKAHKYFPSVGKRSDVELSVALDWFAANGFIVTDRSGEIVGKVSTANMDSAELAALRRSQMRLVESDSDSGEK